MRKKNDRGKGPSLRGSRLALWLACSALGMLSPVLGARGDSPQFFQDHKAPVLSLEVPVQKPIVLSPATRAALSTLLPGGGRREAREFVLEVSCEPASGPAGAPAVRVFLNAPGANRATSLEDPHYVGSFGFFPTAGPAAPGESGPRNFLLSATKTLARLMESGSLTAESPLSVTLVAVKVRESAASAGTVGVGEIRLYHQP